MRSEEDLLERYRRLEFFTAHIWGLLLSAFGLGLAIATLLSIIIK